MSTGLSFIKNIQPTSATIVKVVLIIFFSVGVSGIMLNSTRDIFIKLTPLALVLSLLVIMVYHRPRNLLKEFIFFSAICTAGFLVEAYGVNSGRIFGIYSYGEGLGIKLLDTPLLIGVNWIFMVYCTAAITDRTAHPVVFKVFFASMLMLFYDLVLEQVAPLMNMWSFEGGTAPLKNYLAWFILALIFHSSVKLAGIKIVNRIAPFVLLVQFLFFVILTIFFNLAE